MPVHQPQASYLTLALSSLIVASPRDSEIHIGLDGVCDETCLQILVNLQRRIATPKVRISELKRQGLVATLNQLIRDSDCDYVARHDADDVCLPDRLENQLNALASQPETGFCGTQITRCNSQLIPNRLQRHYPSGFNGQLLYASLMNNPIAHPTLMLRREILGSPAYRHLPGTEDWDLYIRLWEEGYRSFNLKQSGLLYRTHPGQITKRKRDFKLIDDLKQRSLRAATLHQPLYRYLKVIQKASNASKATKLLMRAKTILDQ